MGGGGEGRGGGSCQPLVAPWIIIVLGNMCNKLPVTTTQLL